MSEQQFTDLRMWASAIQAATAGLAGVLDEIEQPDLPSDSAPHVDMVTIRGVSRRIDGTDTERGTDHLVLYTQDPPATNRAGVEVQVIAARVFALYDRYADDPDSTPIPEGGYVLSGHGSAAVWLRTYAVPGAVVAVLTGAVAAPPVAPPDPASHG